ncbi:hypothetical protein EHQ52_05540 [Leptospira koniambonensis]|uniref:Lipoprotein n=1 Tax=Leptospira koniambonensis TaxID=2484950 RepID=A0A4R9J635_9LEPT|nr:hypothetical protein [Leptospira koniambonensis]TGL33990.1 hypothetical protein EHQ52_05540 [Leptospira koniambonensis]
MNKLKFCFLLLLTVGCSSFAVVDPAKNINEQVPQGKTLYFFKANFDLTPASINSVTLNNFDLTHSQISGHTIELGAGSAEKPGVISACYLVAGDDVIYALNSADINASNGNLSVKLQGETVFNLMTFGSKNPIFGGTLSYINGKLSASDNGFEECKKEISAKYPSLSANIAKSEELSKIFKKNREENIKKSNAKK